MGYPFCGHSSKFTHAYLYSSFTAAVNKTTGPGLEYPVKAGQRTEWSYVRVAGVVTLRQRPSTAQALVFGSIEDEKGKANFITYRHLVEKFRQGSYRENFVWQPDRYSMTTVRHHHIEYKRSHIVAWRPYTIRRCRNPVLGMTGRRN